MFTAVNHRFDEKYHRHISITCSVSKVRIIDQCCLLGFKNGMLPHVMQITQKSMPISYEWNCSSLTIGIVDFDLVHGLNLNIKTCTKKLPVNSLYCQTVTKTNNQLG